jgi:hypothetical protein
MEWNQTIQEIVVISPDIDYLSALLLHHLHQDLKEVRLDLFPALPRALELPTIDNIAVQDQTTAIDTLQEVCHLSRSRMLRPEMNIGEDDCRIVSSNDHLFHFLIHYKYNNSYITTRRQLGEKKMKIKRGQPHDWPLST